MQGSDRKRSAGDYYEQQLDLAIRTAVRFHFGQKDKAGKDYIWHPVQVALRVKTNEQKIVALLHDVVEDTECTVEMLRDMGFAEHIVEAIDCITKRKEEDYFDYIRRIKANPLARAVKIEDLKHNSMLSRIPNPSEKDQLRIKKYEAALEILAFDEGELRWK